MARNNDTEIRRRTHRYRVRQLRAHADGEPTSLHVEAPDIDLRRLVVERYVDFRQDTPRRLEES